jgi:hypothetical protein
MIHMGYHLQKNMCHQFGLFVTMFATADGVLNRRQGTPFPLLSRSLSTILIQLN